MRKFPVEILLKKFFPQSSFPLEKSSIFAADMISGKRTSNPFCMLRAIVN